jgi:TRAP-type mannitol/chloroaromatic compound transport system permease small subunit
MLYLKKIANFFDAINNYVGKSVSYLTGALVVLICADVFSRYIFQSTVIWIVELEIYFFALIFLLSAGYTFQHDKHVRVDVFYSKLKPKGQAWVNLIGGILFLLPWCIVILQVAFRYAQNSYLIHEISAQPGGLPALYLLKSAIFVSFVFLLLQAISSIINALMTILGVDNKITSLETTKH